MPQTKTMTNDIASAIVGIINTEVLHGYNALALGLEKQYKNHSKCVGMSVKFLGELVEKSFVQSGEVPKVPEIVMGPQAYKGLDVKNYFMVALKYKETKKAALSQIMSDLFDAGETGLAKSIKPLLKAVDEDYYACKMLINQFEATGWDMSFVMTKSQVENDD